jgi:hypothetical protein
MPQLPCFQHIQKYPAGGAPLNCMLLIFNALQTAPTHTGVGCTYSPRKIMARSVYDGRPRESRIPTEAHVPRSRPLAALGLALLCASLLTVSAAAQDQSEQGHHLPKFGAGLRGLPGLRVLGHLADRRDGSAAAASGRPIYVLMLRKVRPTGDDWRSLPVEVS